MSQGAPANSAPELDSILRLPLAALERELFLSRHEYTTVLASIDATIAESRRLETDLEEVGERCRAGNIYLTSLESDLDTAESEGEQLRREYNWILSLPPSAFASDEMLDWLRKEDAAVQEFDSDSELGLEISASNLAASNRNPGEDHRAAVLLPDQVHPVTSSQQSSSNPARSSSTGSTSSGISSDLHSLVSPEPSINTSKSPLTSPLPPALPPKQRRLIRQMPVSSKAVDKEEDTNSDTGLSSLNSSGEDPLYSLDTLV